MDPEYLVSIVKTLDKEKLQRSGCHLPPLGLGFETFIRWGVENITTAVQAPPGDTQSRLCSSALMDARRALSCLVDQYLLRDGFKFCRDAPTEATGKTKLLVRRGVIDDLAATTLKRSAERRHRVEHNYEAPRLSDAEDMVQNVRATIENAVSKSDPYSSPSLFGGICGGYANSKKMGETRWFTGWNGSLFLLVVIASEPWVGVVIPSSTTKATLQKVAINKISCDQLFDCLSILEPPNIMDSFVRGSGSDYFKGELEITGLW